jgi:hypothetical protein
LQKLSRDNFVMDTRDKCGTLLQNPDVQSESNAMFTCSQMFLK